jgi:hypothetical protein
MTDKARLEKLAAERIVAFSEATAEIGELLKAKPVDDDAVVMALVEKAQTLGIPADEIARIEEASLSEAIRLFKVFALETIKNPT